jgi:hypothetical protein
MAPKIKGFSISSSGTLSTFYDKPQKKWSYHDPDLAPLRCRFSKSDWLSGTRKDAKYQEGDSTREHYSADPGNDSADGGSVRLTLEHVDEAAGLSHDAQNKRCTPLHASHLRVTQSCLSTRSTTATSTGALQHGHDPRETKFDGTLLMSLFSVRSWRSA